MNNERRALLVAACDRVLDDLRREEDSPALRTLIRDVEALRERALEAPVDAADEAPCS